MSYELNIVKLNQIAHNQITELQISHINLGNNAEELMQAVFRYNRSVTKVTLLYLDSVQVESLTSQLLLLRNLEVICLFYLTEQAERAFYRIIFFEMWKKGVSPKIEYYGRSPEMWQEKLSNFTPIDPLPKRQTENENEKVINIQYQALGLFKATANGGNPEEERLKLPMPYCKPINISYVNPAITTKFWFTQSTGSLEVGKQEVGKVHSHNACHS